MASRVSTLQNLPLVPVIGGMFGLVASVLVVATPAWLFEQTIVSLGLGTPPVGIATWLFTTVAAFALAGIAVGALVYLAERVVELWSMRQDDTDGLDLAAFAATVAASQPRRPISAVSELGAPLMSDEALQTIAPMTDFGWDADSEKGFNTMAPDPGSPAKVGLTSIEELIQRLETGMARRGPPPTDPDGSAVTPPRTASKSSWIVREDDVDDTEPSTRMQRSAAG